MSVSVLPAYVLSGAGRHAEIPSHVKGRLERLSTDNGHGGCCGLPGGQPQWHVFPCLRDDDGDALASIAGVVFCDSGKLGRVCVSAVIDGVVVTQFDEDWSRIGGSRAGCRKVIGTHSKECLPAYPRSPPNQCRALRPPTVADLDRRDGTACSGQRPVPAATPILPDYSKGRSTSPLRISCLEPPLMTYVSAVRNLAKLTRRKFHLRA